MIPLEDALARVMALLPPPRAEEVGLLDADGRVLMAPVTAGRDQPPFDSSAMDGFAVRAADATPGATLRIVGEAPAGRAWEGRLGAGEALRILTGAPLPAGADAVVIQEETSRDGDRLTLSATAVASHVRPRGNDFRAGATIPVGAVLTPARLALAAAMGAARLTVAARPDVAILSTGDELAWPGEPLRDDQIVASNAFGLAALVRAAGGVPRLLPIAPDDPVLIGAALDHARGADVLVTIGGASVGDRDHMADVLRAAGVDLAVHKVALRPGKPLMAGRGRDGMVVLGLPGNPVSAMVTGVLVLRPVLRAMQGLAPEQPAERPLAAPLPANGPRAHYLRGRVHADGSVTAFDRQDSSLLTLLAEADVLIRQEPGSPALAAGSAVATLPLGTRTA